MVSRQQEQQRLQELGDFLRSRRDQLTPEQVGLTPDGRRRTSGLRRTEVAQLAGISVDWYTWLEQGRPITVSIQVLESLVQALRLNASEREHLFFLAHQQPPPEKTSLHETVNPTIQHFLDHLDTSPAYVTEQHWNIIAWNQAACTVFGDFRQMTARERNVIWRMFLSPEHRQMLVNWEEHAQHILAQFRATNGRFFADPQMQDLLNELLTLSPEFRTWWPHHTVLRVTEGQKVFNHPHLGHLTFEHLTFQIYSTPNLQVTVYTPVAEPNSTTWHFPIP